MINFHKTNIIIKSIFSQSSKDHMASECSKYDKYWVINDSEAILKVLKKILICSENELFGKVNSTPFLY